MSRVQAVWGDEPPESNNLKVHLFNLRKQIDDGSENKLIHTMTGRGFAVKDSQL